MRASTAYCRPPKRAVDEEERRERREEGGTIEATILPPLKAARKGEALAIAVIYI
jgi:hypothetical protein